MIVHLHTGRSILAGTGYRLYISNDKGVTWRLLTRIPRRGLRALAARGRHARRLLRAGVRHVVPMSDDRAEHSLLVVADRRVWRIEGDEGREGRVRPGAPIVGSNPLCTPAVSGGAVFYGEYRSNPERSPVHVWRSVDGGETFRPVWTFERARHVHGVFADPYRPGTLWVTTGDDDEESAIYRTRDSFQSVEPVVVGGQQARAVDLVFAPEFVYYGSDTPRERNFLYRLRRPTVAPGAGGGPEAGGCGRASDRGRPEPGAADVPERLAAPAGSVFWGRSTPDGWRVFATTVERSAVNRSRDAELWAAPPESEDWRRILSRRKDGLSDKYFDHGQLRPAHGPAAPGEIWVTPYATHGDQRSIRVDLQRAWESGPEPR